MQSIHEIIKELRANLTVLYETLCKNQRSGALDLAKALDSVQGRIDKNIKALDSKIQALYANALKFDPQIAQQVNQLRIEFRELLNANTSKTALLKGLMHRVKCK